MKELLELAKSLPDEAQGILIAAAMLAGVHMWLKMVIKNAILPLSERLDKINAYNEKEQKKLSDRQIVLEKDLRENKDDINSVANNQRNICAENQRLMAEKFIKKETYHEDKELENKRHADIDKRHEKADEKIDDIYKEINKISLSLAKIMAKLDID